MGGKPGELSDSSGLGRPKTEGIRRPKAQAPPSEEGSGMKRRKRTQPLGVTYVLSREPHESVHHLTPASVCLATSCN